MVVLGFTIFFLLAAKWFAPSIRKHNTIIYTLAALLSILAYFLEIPSSIQGYIGTSLLVLVMFAGALNKRSSWSKILRGVRQEYSILGFITLTPHIIYYILLSFTAIENFELFGTIAYLVMVPLTIISFPKIKRKMKFQKWKHYQLYAYLAYAGIYIHLLMISSTQGVVYTLLFGMYVALQIWNNSTLKPAAKKALAGFIFLFSLSQLSLAVEQDNLQATDLLLPTTTINSSYSGTVSSAVYEDGTFQTSVAGFRRETLSVEVVVSEGMIQEINILSSGTTGGRYEMAVNQVASWMEQANTYDVDTVNGSTISTSALIKAVESVLVEVS